MATNYAQPKTGIGSTAETNRLLGRTGSNAFTETSDPSATDPERSKFVASLNAARESAVNSGRDPYAGNLGSLTTFSGSGQGTGTGTGTGLGTSASDPFSAYRGYLGKYSESLSEDPAVSSARTGLAEISGEIDKRDLEARREYETTLDTPGMLKAGAEAAATRGRRRSNSELADLAVRQGGAARTYEALSTGQSAKQNFLKTQAELAKPYEVAGSYYDPITGKKIESTKENAPFELSPGQARYTYNPATGEYEETAKLAPLPKEPTKLTESEKKQPMIDDVNSAVSQLGQIVKSKGFRGISPDDYNTMRAYLQSEYGYEGVAEFDKALATLGLTVDYSGK